MEQSQQGYLHCIANFFATVLNIFSREIISKSTVVRANVKNKFWNANETLESTGEIKLMVKFYWDCRIFLNLEMIFFLEFPYKKMVFRVISGNYLCLKLFENAKRTVLYLKVFRYKVFVYLKLQLLQSANEIFTFLCTPTSNTTFSFGIIQSR